MPKQGILGFYSVQKLGDPFGPLNPFIILKGERVAKLCCTDTLRYTVHTVGRMFRGFKFDPSDRLLAF